MATGQSKRRYLAAMVLGTALAAGQGATTGAEEISGRTIQNISRYCTTCWRNARLPADDWSDCTQEVLRRLLERLEPDAWEQVLAREGEERKEFIRAIDAVKKRSQRQRPAARLLDDPSADVTSQDERDALQEAAGRVLTPRQRRILNMTCDGWSVADIAQELDTAAQRISDEKYKAIAKLRLHFSSQPA
jgi:RNA polymerase sigma factor (sigma-70 family)